MRNYQIKLSKPDGTVYYNAIVPFENGNKASIHAMSKMDNKNDKVSVVNLPNTNNDLFKAVAWPLSQELMEIEGFYENSSLINDDPLCDEYGSSAYFVRVSWLNSLETIKPTDTPTIDVPDNIPDDIINQ